MKAATKNDIRVPIGLLAFGVTVGLRIHVRQVVSKRDNTASASHRQGRNGNRAAPAT
jgi:hypothetical protein